MMVALSARARRRSVGRRTIRLGPAISLVGILATGCLNTSTDSADESTGATIAASTTTTTEVELRVFYTVQRGDTLVQIANRFEIDLNALVRENGIADPTRIYVGQQLLIPPPQDEDEGPSLTIAPATNPDLPPITPPLEELLRQATTGTSEAGPQ